MAEWTTEFLDRTLLDGEIEISQVTRCIFARYSIPIVAGTSIYTLPTGILDILNITWLGLKLEQFNPNMFDASIRPHDDSIQSSRPQYYVVNGYDYDTIRFFPTPSLSYSQVSDLTKGADIESGICMSYSRVADGSSYRVPVWLRALLLEKYQNYKKFSSASKWQSLEAATFYKAAFDSYLAKFNEIIYKIPSAVEHRFGSNIFDERVRRARPVLPEHYPGRR